MNEQIQARLDKAVQLMPTTISPFHLAQVATVVVGRKVYGPMLYTLAKKGYIETHQDGNGKTKIAQVEAVRWLVQYCSRGEGARTSEMTNLLTEIKNS